MVVTNVCNGTGQLCRLSYDVVQVMFSVVQALLPCCAGYAMDVRRLYWMLRRYNCIIQTIMLLRGPSFKMRLDRYSAKLKFQDGPSVAKSICFNNILIYQSNKKVQRKLTVFLSEAWAGLNENIQHYFFSHLWNGEITISKLHTFFWNTLYILKVWDILYLFWKLIIMQV